MGRHRLFVRRRDGRVEVRLNDAGREVVREAVGHVVAAEQDPDHEWRSALSPPLDPSADVDDPVAVLARGQEISRHAELVVLTLREQFLTEAEAWAWLTTLQVALRATALSLGLIDEARLEGAPPEDLVTVRTLQQLLFDLAEAL